MRYRVSVVVVLGLLAGMTVTCTDDKGPDRAANEDAGQKVETKTVAACPGDNRLCLVCHADLDNEMISRVHARKGILCTECHGPSSAHMEDEMLMTKPDVLFGRSEVDSFCKKCHAKHPHGEEMKAFLDKWLGRDRPNGRVITSQSICTDCHGTHNIRKTEPGDESPESARWILLFNGKDLAGWESTGNAKWFVENGMLVGTQGDNNAPGDLFTQATYKDFLLTVTYKVVWPANTGIWFRYQSDKLAYQADILEYAKPECYSGTLYCPGKMFLAMNTDKNLVDKEGWNTMSVRAEGDHLQIWLNGHQVADVHDPDSPEGKIGFQVHAGDQFATMKVVVREARIQPLGDGK